MLFNSYEFICLFLPLCLVVFHLLTRWAPANLALTWLVLASLFFYGWWNPAYLGLIASSVVFNFVMGRQLVNAPPRGKRGLLAIALCANLALLGYFKYANFFVDASNQLFSSGLQLDQILLPLAISFFTLQQVAYLIDAWRGNVPRYSFLHYTLFVTFFPQLIAGPIVHHRELIPQFLEKLRHRTTPAHFAIGLTIFIIGLAKKVILADNVGLYADIVFNMAEAGLPITGVRAWEGALAYIFQIYFDFSGYSDMAIGLAMMFGFLLPQNFASPYKASNFTDFWNRWHMTLSRFLRDYLYIPLGGSRAGRLRHNFNLLLTMLIGGIWHGAGWTFVCWGFMCGVFLVINSNWRKFRAQILGHDLNKSSKLATTAGWLLTFGGFTLSGIFFRGETLSGSLQLFSAIFGTHGYADVFNPAVTAMLAVCFFVCLCCPNALEIAGLVRDFKASPWWRGRWSWRPAPAWGMAMGALFFLCFALLGEENVFLYFQF